MASRWQAWPARLHSVIRGAGGRGVRAASASPWRCLSSTAVPVPVGPLGSLIGNILDHRSSRRRIGAGSKEIALPSVLDAAIVHSARHRFPKYKELLELLEQGAILEVMTRFCQASKQWERVRQGQLELERTNFEITPHIINDLLQSFSRQATDSSREWRPDFRQLTRRQDPWTPPQLAEVVDARVMKVPDLCVYALVAVYDIGLSLGILPSSASLAATLFALSKKVDEETFSQSVVLLLLQCSGHSAQISRKHALEQDSKILEMLDYKSFSPGLLAAIVDGYSRYESPQKGETLMQHWANSIATAEDRGPSTDLAMTKEWKAASDSRQNALPPPVWVNSSGWANEMSLWAALVRSRGNAHDLAGARHWLHRYRQEGLAAVRARFGKHCGQPHVEYINACTKVQHRDVSEHGRSRASAEGWIEGGKPRYRAISDAVRTMYQDGASLPDTLFTTILNVQVGNEKLKEALSLVSAYLDSNAPPWHSGFYKALFRLQTKIYLRQPDTMTHLLALGRDDPEKSCVGDVRELFRHLVSLPAFQGQDWSIAVKVKMLNEALRASIASRQLPLALVILDTFRSCFIPVDSHTRAIVTTMLHPKLRNQTRQINRERHRAAQMEKTRLLMMEHQEQHANEPPLVEVTLHTATTDDLLKSVKGRPNGDVEVFRRLVSIRIANVLRDAMESGPSADDPQWVHNACLHLARTQPESMEIEDLVQAALLADGALLTSE